MGALGTITNLAIYTTLVFLDINYNIAAVCAFIVAVTQNFLLNKRWTFKDHDQTTTHRYWKYFILNFMSFLLNLAVLNLIIYFFGTSKSVQIIAQIIGILSAMGTNFIGSHILVFKTHKRGRS